MSMESTLSEGLGALASDFTNHRFDGNSSKNLAAFTMKAIPYMESVTPHDIENYINNLVRFDVKQNYLKNCVAPLAKHYTENSELTEAIRLLNVRLPTLMDMVTSALTDLEPHPLSDKHGALPRLSRYEITSQIGVGGFGVVWKAIDLDHDKRPVAIKVLRKDNDTDLGRKRFFDEYNETKRLAGEGVIPVYDLIKDEDNRSCMVMQYVENGSLRELIKESGFIIPLKAAVLVKNVAGTLQRLHEQDLVHRDIKPGNILVATCENDRVEEVYVADFGLALPSDRQPSNSKVCLGTPKYWSPQQAKGASDLFEPRHDIFSLGLVLIEMLTGQLPYRYNDSGEASIINKEVIMNGVQPPAIWGARLPSELVDICVKATRWDPGHRYDSAKEMQRALELFIASCSNTEESAIEFSRGPLSSGSNTYITRECDDEVRKILGLDSQGAPGNRPCTKLGIIGPFGVGKTSLMRQIPAMLGEDWKIVGGSGSADLRGEHPQLFVKHFLQRFQSVCGEVEKLSELTGKLSKKKVVIFLDDLANLEQPGLIRALFELDRIASDNPSNVRLVVTIGGVMDDTAPVQSLCLDGNEKRPLNERVNPKAYQGWRYVSIPPFSHPECEALLNRLPKQLRKIAKDNIGTIIKFSTRSFDNVEGIGPRLVHGLCETIMYAYRANEPFARIKSLLQSPDSYGEEITK